MRTLTAISVCTQGRAILNLKLEVLQGMCIPTDEGLVDLSSDCLVAMSAITFHSGTQSNTDQHHVGSFLRTSPCSSRIAHLQLCRALLVKDKHKPESPSFFQTQLVSCWQEGVLNICLYRVSDLLEGKIVAAFPLDARSFPACAVITFSLWTKEWFEEEPCWLT